VGPIYASDGAKFKTAYALQFVYQESFFSSVILDKENGSLTFCKAKHEVIHI
jgi:hypothetical protein